MGIFEGKKVFTISFDSGENKWWLLEDAIGDRPFESEADFDQFDNLTNGYRWGIAVKESSRSRKWKHFGGVSLSILAQLDTIKHALDEYHSVVCLTPDIAVIFVKV